MGFGFSHYVLYLHMQKTFNKRRGLATGIFAATRAASSTLMPQLVVYLSTAVGPSNMMRILAATSTLSIVFAAAQTHKDRFRSDHLSSFRRSVKKPIAASTLTFSSSPGDRDQQDQGVENKVNKVIGILEGIWKQE
jgi:cyanate permease